MWRKAIKIYENPYLGDDVGHMTMFFIYLVFCKPKISASWRNPQGGSIKKNFRTVKEWLNMEQADLGQRCCIVTRLTLG